MKKVISFLLSIFALLSLDKPIYANMTLPPTPGQKRMMIIEQVKSISYLTVGNAFIELLVLYLLGFRTKRVMLSILLANMISFIPFTLWLMNTSSLGLNVIFMELGIVVFESMLIYYLNQKYSFLSVFAKVFVANLITFAIGFFITIF